MKLCNFSRVLRWALFVGLVLGAPLHAVDFQDHEIVVERELLITDPQVVDSDYAKYPGAWSFGYLLEEAFGREQAPEQVAAWLAGWVSGDWKVNNNPLKTPGRAGLRAAIIEQWQKKDGYRAESGSVWSPQLANAPFRLLAIVNRMDLALPNDILPSPSGGSAGYNSSGPTDGRHGEGRLVFGLVDENGKPVEKGLTLILEYGLDLNTKEARLDWAMAWHALGKHQSFDQAYRDDLRAVTRCFTDRCHESKTETDPKKPKSVIDQLMDARGRDRMQLLRIRSNDGVGGELREFREFAFEKTTLVPKTLTSSPREEFFDKNSSANRKLANWLEDDAAQAQTVWLEQMRLNRDPSKPPVKRAVTLPIHAAGFVSVAADENTHWDGRGLGDETLRREISLQSCCGCHCGDTNTSFYHIAPRAEGEAAAVSNFLRTNGRSWSLKDPGTKSRMRSAEMNDRKEFFASLLDPHLSHSEKKRIREARQLRVH